MNSERPFLLVHRDDGWWITGPLDVELGPYKTPAEASADPRGAQEKARYDRERNWKSEEE